MGVITHNPLTMSIAHHRPPKLILPAVAITFFLLMIYYIHESPANTETPSISVPNSNAFYSSPPSPSPPTIATTTVTSYIFPTSCDKENDTKISSFPAQSKPFTRPKPNIPLPSHIPEKIWYKLGPLGITTEAGERIHNCLKRNPTYRHEFLAETTAKMYVRENYAHRPDIVNLYNALTVPILRADLLRYLILYHEGGVWSDLDISCEDVPMKRWIPEEYKDRTGMVVGLEFDVEWQGDGVLYSQFASWMIMSKPKSEHMGMIINDVINGLDQIALDYGVEMESLTMDMVPDVVDFTGPKRMTLSIVRSLSLMLGEPLDDRNISRLKEPKLLGDVLIMPGRAFASLQSGHPEDQGPALATHHYAGSWKNLHGGELM